MASNLSTRVVTAAWLVAFLLLVGGIAFFYPSMKWLLLVVSFVAVEIAAWEFSKFSTVGPSESYRRYIYLAIVSLCPVVTLILLSGVNICLENEVLRSASLAIALGVILSTLSVIAFLVFSTSKDLEQGARACRELLLATILIGFGGSALMALSVYGSASINLLWFILVLAVNDSAAYFVGRSVGGPKLSPVISPNKTISGSIGGIAGAAIVGVLSSMLISTSLSLLCIALVASALAISAQLGDLSKSYLKRLHGVKDSGTLLPGHGGVLDRIDSYLLASPAFLLLLLYLGLG